MGLAVALFGGAILVGLSMALLYVRNGRNPPVPLAAVHGLFVAAGFVALVVHAVSAPQPGSALAAASLLAFPALAGGYLLSVHMRGRTLSFQHVLVHALFALVAYGGLIALTLWKG